MHKETKKKLYKNIMKNLFTVTRNPLDINFTFEKSFYFGIPVITSLLRG